MFIKLYLVVGFIVYFFLFLKGMINPKDYIKTLIMCLFLGVFVIGKYYVAEKELEDRLKEKKNKKLEED